MFKINGHGHLLPYPNEIPSFMKDEGIFWVDHDRKHMRQNGWKRPITDDSFFLEEKLAWMEKNDIQHEVILNLSQLYCNGIDKVTTKKVTEFQNNFNAKVQSDHQAKFTGGFVIQPCYIHNAIFEIKRCVEDLGLQMMCLPTHYQKENGRWTSIADDDVSPIFEMADNYKLAIEIHPYDAPKMISLENEYWRFHLVWMLAQTADAYHIFTLKGLHEKFKNIRVCFAHGNQFGQINFGRRIQGFLGRPDLFEGSINPGKSIGYKNIYFDTLLHDLLSFELLIKRQGISQIVAGLDDPYPLGEMESVPGSYPGKLIDLAAENKMITLEEKSMIWFDNVVEWLCGDDKTAFLNRLGVHNLAQK